MGVGRGGVARARGARTAEVDAAAVRAQPVLARLPGGEQWQGAVPAAALDKGPLKATSGGWALASDGVQWILQRRYANGWRNVSFVRSGKDILARCMRENGVEVFDARQLLAPLPETFDLWKSHHRSPQEALSPP